MEVIWTVTANGVVSILDPQTGTKLKSWRLASNQDWNVSQTGLMGQWLAMAPRSSHALYLWNHCYLSGRVKGFQDPFLQFSCCAFDDFWLTQHHFIGTGNHGKIMVWDLSSGIFLAAFQAHYRSLARISATSDSQLILAMDPDGMLKTWFFQDILCSFDSENGVPLIYTMSNHAPATNWWVGRGNWDRCVGLLGFEDKSCKMIRIRDGKHLATFVFPDVPNTVILDVLQTTLFGGSRNGNIYLFSINTTLSPANRSEMVLKGHETLVTWLEMSLDCSTLFSGDSQGNVYVWDVANRIRIRSIDLGCSSALVHLKSCLVSPHLDSPPLCILLENTPKPFQRTISDIEDRSTLRMTIFPSPSLDAEPSQDGVEMEPSQELQYYKAFYHEFVIKTFSTQ